LSKSELLLDEALGGFVEIWARKEMVDPPKAGVMSLQEQVALYNKRLLEHNGWNLGVEDGFGLLIQEIRKIVTNDESKVDLKDLEKKFKNATEAINVIYERVAKIMMGQTPDGIDDKFKELIGSCKDLEKKISWLTWNDIIKTCKDLEGKLPAGRCLQSATDLKPLYTDALAVHDDNYWKYEVVKEGGETHLPKDLEDIKEGMVVIKKMAPKLFENEGGNSEVRGTVTCVKESFVTISWPDKMILKEGVHVLSKDTETRHFRFDMKPFEKALLVYEKMHGVHVSYGPIKKLYRVVQKMLRAGNYVECAAIMDVVRATFMCDSNEVIRKVLESLGKDESITICKVKEGYSNHKTGAWVDVKIIFYLNPVFGADGKERIQEPWNERKHKCELQIVHRLMSHARTDMGGHKIYSQYRGLGEAIVALEGDTQRTVEFTTIRKAIVNFLTSGQTAEIHELRHLFGMESAIGRAPATAPTGVAALSLDEYLGQYDNIPLDEYVDDGNFWFINKGFKDLRIISKDPFIILLPNLLSEEQCKELMRKAGPHMKQSRVYNPTTRKYGLDPKRTSWDVYFPYDEVPKTQNIFSEALNMPVENMEPLKGIRYAKGEAFKKHNDASVPDPNGAPFCRAPYANRVISCFAYLNTPASGGETHFLKSGIKVQPFRGMGVVHFPAYLDTATYVKPDSVQVGSKVKARLKAGAAPGSPHGRPFSGTVTNVEDGKASVLFDFDGQGRTRHYDIAKEGDLKLAENDYTLLPHMKGAVDERVLHEGMPAIDEKFIVSQWCWPSRYDLTKMTLIKDTVESLNDGIVL
jgi:hypothetical protein